MLAYVAAVAVLLASAAAAAPARHVVASCTPGQDCGLADLQLTGTVTPTQAAVGGSLTWQLTVNDRNTSPVLNVYVDVTLPANVTLNASSTDRGKGCTATSATTLHCDLDWLSGDVQFGHVTLVTTVNATGDHALTAVTGYSSASGPVADPNPADNTVTLTATTPAPPPPPLLPVISAGVITPAIAIHGKRASVSFTVTRSDNSSPLTEGTMLGSAAVAGKSIASIQTFANGVAKLTFTVPKTAKGKLLTVKVTVTASGGPASKVATFRVR